LAISYENLKLCARIAPGEWLLSGYIATGMENVLFFIKADNSEQELEKFLELVRPNTQ